MQWTFTMESIFKNMKFTLISQEEINEAVADAFMIFVPKEDKLRAHNKDLKNFKFEIE